MVVIIYILFFHNHYIYINRAIYNYIILSIVFIDYYLLFFNLYALYRLIIVMVIAVIIIIYKIYIHRSRIDD